MSETKLNMEKLTYTQQQFVRARYVSTPLILIRTADPATCIASLAAVSQTPQSQPAPVIQWDAVNGFSPLSEPSRTVVAQTGAQKNMGGALETMRLDAKVPKHTAVFMHIPMPDMVFRDMFIVQAIWNLRDPYKKDWRTLVMIVPAGSVPMALEHDVFVIDDPLPGPKELEKILTDTVKAARLDDQKPDEVNRAVDAVAGLSPFAAEQAIAMSLRQKGIDHAVLRDRHRQMIQNTKGLSVWRGGETFASIGGLANWKRFADKFIKGTYRFGSVFWIDEIEKAFGGLRGDLTGISQDYLGVLLGYMADHSVPGILLMGHPGTAKSLSAKAFGNTAGVPTVRADLQAMHGSLVGESQHALRHALKVVTAISQGRPLFIATCNSVAILPPEFLNRFKYRFFFDLPDDEEKAAIWPIHRKSYAIDDKQAQPDDKNLNGREIEQICASASELRVSLVAAREFIVPIAESSAEQIEMRRQEANGRYLSASQPGPYTMVPRESVTVGGIDRKIRLPDTPWAAPGSDKVN